MFNKSIIVRLGGLLFICLPGMHVSGADNRFQPIGGILGDWNDANNWSQFHVPNATERAVIPFGRTCFLADTDGVADSLCVMGRLQIENCSLTLDGSTSAEHTMPGTLLLEWSISSVKFVDRDHTLAGSPGAIWGLEPGARLEDDGQGRTLQVATGVSILGRLNVDLNVVNNGVINSFAVLEFKQTVTNNANAAIHSVGSVIFDGPLASDGAIDSVGTLTCNDSVDNDGRLFVRGVGQFGGPVTNKGSVSVGAATACDFNGSAVNSGLIYVIGSTTFSASISGEGTFWANGGDMIFAAGSSATHITGDFAVTHGGEVHVNADVHTKGFLKTFSGSGSRIKVAEGKSISFGR